MRLLRGGGDAGQRKNRGTQQRAAPAWPAGLPAKLHVGGGMKYKVRVKTFSVLCRECGPESPLNRPELAADFVRGLLRPHDQDREHFAIVALDAELAPIGAKVLFSGAFDHAQVDPSTMWRAFFLPGPSSRIIVAHNHPSGNVTPSEEDKALAALIKKQADLLGVELIDFIIVVVILF